MRSKSNDVKKNTIQGAILRSAACLEQAGIPSSRLEAEILLAHVLGINRIELYKNSEQYLESNEIDHFEKLISKRVAGEPTAYLRGEKEFFSLTFKVGPGVLIPRAETELLVEESLAILATRPSPFILELGTGSGAVLISILVHLPTARGVGTDISLSALQYAHQNAKKHKLENRIKFFEGDLFQALKDSQFFDLIVFNPPYIPTQAISSDLRFEPKEALDGGNDGLHYYREVLANAWEFLNEAGFLILEIGTPQVEALEREIKKVEQYDGLPIYKNDLSGLKRAVILQRKKGRNFKK